MSPDEKGGPKATTQVRQNPANTLTEDTRNADDIMAETQSPSVPAPCSAVLLSAFLAGCSPEELRLIIQDYNKGLMTVLNALPVNGKTFTVNVRTLHDYLLDATIPDELILDTPEARQWRDEKAEESRLTLLVHTGKFAVDMDILNDTTGEFLKLCQARRAYLKRKEETPREFTIPQSRQKKGKRVPSKNPNHNTAPPLSDPPQQWDALTDLADILAGTAEET